MQSAALWLAEYCPTSVTSLKHPHVPKNLILEVTSPDMAYLDAQPDPKP
jgi:hypothetical protein